MEVKDLLKTNVEKLIETSVRGEVIQPRVWVPQISHKGEPLFLPSTGGITYNVRIGDSAFGWAGDHIEPGVTIRAKDEGENAALNVLACIGNVAKVVSGDAKGESGFVTGKHGGAEHVLVYFPREVLEKLNIGDQVLVMAKGQGLKIIGWEDIFVCNIDPGLLEKLNIEEKDGKLVVPVVAEVPAHLMGSGIGSTQVVRGDYDIMTADAKELEAYGLQNLRLGDFVLLRDCDNTYGRGFLKGAVSIGVVIHSDCVWTGHGPGVTVIMSSKEGRIEGRIDKNANLANYLNII
jgi:hypothetical protein